MDGLGHIEIIYDIFYLQVYFMIFESIIQQQKIDENIVNRRNT